MLTSRTGLAALLTVGALHAGAWGGSIRGQYDLWPHGPWGHNAPAVSTSWLDNDLDHVLQNVVTTVKTTTTPSAPPLGWQPAPAVTQTHPSGPGGVTALHSYHDGGPPIAPVPEPSGVALAVSGLGALVLVVRRRRARSA